MDAFTELIRRQGELKKRLAKKESKQFERHVTAKVKTTDGTATTLTTYTIPASTTVFVRAHIVARRTGGAAGAAEDGAAYIRWAAFKNVAGTATLIGTVALPFTVEDQAGWNATLDVNLATMRVRVQGAANNNISWRCDLDIITMNL